MSVYIEEGLKNPFWKEVSQRRQELRGMVLGEGQSSVRDNPRLLALIEDLLEKLKPALADELEAFTWGDGELYHLKEAEVMETLQGRLLKRRKELRNRAATSILN